MAIHPLTPPLRVLRAGLHLMVGGLLALAAGKAVGEHSPHAAATVAAAALVAVVYAVGPMLPRAGIRRAAASQPVVVGRPSADESQDDSRTAASLAGQPSADESEDDSPAAASQPMVAGRPSADNSQDDSRPVMSRTAAAGRPPPGELRADQSHPTAASPIFPAPRTSPSAAALWIIALMAAWLLLVVLTADGVWLSFPLFFLQLHLLRIRWALLAVALTTAAAVIGFSVHAGGVAAGTVIGPVLGAAVAVAVVRGYQALYRESEQRRRLIDELTEARTGLAAAEREAGVLAERERLAREIHDTLSQGLTSISLLLRAAERAIPEHPDTALGHVRNAREAAVDNLAEARRFVRALSPPDLENGSLPAALRRLAATVAATSGMAVGCHVSGDPSELPTQHEVALLRIAQSALANAVQHAGATRVEMTLSFMDTEVALDVVDDGAGFAGPAAETGFGLSAMRARASELRGTFVVESAPGEGTALAVTLPIPFVAVVCDAPEAAPEGAPEAAPENATAATGEAVR